MMNAVFRPGETHLLPGSGGGSVLHGRYPQGARPPLGRGSQQSPAPRGCAPDIPLRIG
jgi:hypothetical protein